LNLRPLVPNQVLVFFEFFRERETGKFSIFSKACKSLFRRRFRETEDAPLAAYLGRHSTQTAGSDIFSGALPMRFDDNVHAREYDPKLQNFCGLA
jgi:hypothetical protein